MASTAPIHDAVGNDDFDFDLGEEINDIFGAAIKLGMALLPSKAFRFGDGDAGHSRFVKRFFHFIELEWLDNRLNFFHRRVSRRIVFAALASPELADN